MSIRQVAAVHYRVVCALCRRDAFVCPERQASVDLFERSARAFVRAGWHYDPPRLRHRKQQQAAEGMGEGTWYCAACAARRP